jgi:DNA (cytosine-5)-methyltransferase 1
VIYGSVCSGIEAASVAWHALGWRPAFFSEIEAFPRALLAERWPGVPVHGDFTTIKDGEYEPIELLVGGTPCQDFSVRGLRAGLAGERGNLTIEFVRLARRLRPRWVVWENVPGVLSVDGGRAFGAFLGGLGQCGYGFAYRVLDAQFAGVPQRRRRVFVVGYLGDWRPAAAVLFEPESLRRDPPPRREAGERVAPTISVGTGGCSGHQYRQKGNETADNLIPLLEVGKRTNGDGYRDGDGFGKPGDPMFSLQAGARHGIAFGGNNTAGPLDVATACNAHGGPHGRLDFESETFVTHSLRADGFDASEDGTGRGVPLTLAIRGRGDSHDLEWRDDGIANAVLTPNGGRAGIGVGAVAFSAKDHGGDAGDTAPTLRAGGHTTSHANAGVMPAVMFDPTARQPEWAIQQAMTVRRLTPRECERLQGFPDDYTLAPYRGKPAADGPRYRALGNSMAVPCMRWIGERIETAERRVGLPRSRR